MSSLFGLNKPTTNLRKNVFDLSEHTLFSMSAGMLLPCFTREVNPGEKVQVHVSSFTRTQPLNTAAFVRCRQYYHWFFVPYKQLWMYWDNFINGVDFRTSALMASSKNKTLVVPSIGMLQAIGAVAGASIWKRYSDSDMTTTEAVKSISKDEFGYPLYCGASRLFDMLGYGFSFTHDKPKQSALSHIRQNPSDSNYYFVPRSLYEKHPIKGYTPIPVSGSDLVLIEKKYLEQFLLSLKLTFNTLTEFIESFGTDTDFYNLLKPFHTGQNKSQDRSINLFRFLAYQKIYHDFYRREDYEASNPSYFNIDDINQQGTNLINGARLSEIFRLRYRWQPKDLFTGVVPSELFGANTVFSGTGFEQFGTLSVPSTGEFDDNKGVQIGSAQVTTKSIRAAFAIEKMLRLTRRAGGQDYISQISAHYGFEPPKGRGDKVDFLGGSSSNINVSEVVTTADSGEAVVGQVFGKGSGVVGEKDGYIDFTVREHGLVMCIASVVPDTEYSSEGLNSFNTKLKRGDYFQPELQDLGLQPLFGHEFRNSGEFKGSNYTDSIRSSVLGFVPRYSEYKTAYDTLHGEFRNGRTLSAWASRSTLNADDTGVFVNTLKINPKCLDSIFAISYDGRELTDQFMVSAQFLCKIVRPMSVTGQQL